MSNKPGKNTSPFLKKLRDFFAVLVSYLPLGFQKNQGNCFWRFLNKKNMTSFANSDWKPWAFWGVSCTLLDNCLRRTCLDYCLGSTSLVGLVDIHCTRDIRGWRWRQGGIMRSAKMEKYAVNYAENCGKIRELCRNYAVIFEVKLFWPWKGKKKLKKIRATIIWEKKRNATDLRFWNNEY